MATIWEVDLFISGPITIKGSHIHLNEPKGTRRFQDPFYSDILIRSFGDKGVKATITASASTQDLAGRAAMYFFSQMLDVLAWRMNLPLDVSVFEMQQSKVSQKHSKRRIVNQDDWHQAFQTARLMAFEQPQFLTALGWFRKGLVSENPIDKFLAFWNAVERIAKSYHNKDERTKKGVKNQVWQCFITVWGECELWPIITGDNKWIDDNYDIRNDIAHGERISIKEVQKIIDELETIEKVARQFQLDWYDKELDMTISPAFAELYHIDMNVGVDRYSQNIR